ncbi:MAG: flagellar basal body-associated FliL family protein [Clostridiales bacterium]|nr:flagellar basal body-associated FliL family protein [Clostridiales bacterium]
MKKIIILVVAVLVLAGGAAYFFLLKPKPEPPPVTFSPGDYFVTNVKDSNRLLKVTLVLMVSGDKAYKKLPLTLEENISKVRDIILFILRDMGEEEIRASGVEETLRIKICEGLNETFETDGIIGLWFRDFVMQ